MALYINCTSIETSKRNGLEVSAENSADGLSLGAVGQAAAPDTGRLTPDCSCLLCRCEPPRFREALSSGKEGRALGDEWLFAFQEDSRFKVAFAMGFLSWSLSALKCLFCHP